jgi:hypothetical protein
VPFQNIAECCGMAKELAENVSLATDAFAVAKAGH